LRRPATPQSRVSSASKRLPSCARAARRASSSRRWLLSARRRPRSRHFGPSLSPRVVGGSDMQPYVIAAALAIAASAAVSPQQRANPADSTKRVAPAAGDLQQLKDQVTRLPGGADSLVPPADRFSFGDRAISAGTAVQGPIAIARGNLDVSGTVDGDA